jgi:membrane-associated phospholipid phosphatase
VIEAVLSLFVLAGAAAAEARPALTAPSPAETPRFALPDEFAGDGRRTLGQLPRNLGRSFAGVFSRDNLGPLLVGMAAAGVSSRFDQRAQSSLGGFAPGASSAASKAGGMSVVLPAAASLFAAGRFAGDGHFRAFTYDATQALVVDMAYTSALKHLASRTRPDGSDRLSFPSGHTSSAFALATVADAHYGWKLGVPSYLAASAIGLSRISMNRHHLSDVVAGAAIGYVTARTVVKVNGEPRGRHRRLSLHPQTDASGSGAGAGVSLSW